MEAIADDDFKSMPQRDPVETERMKEKAIKEAKAEDAERAKRDKEAIAAAKKAVGGKTKPLPKEHAPKPVSVDLKLQKIKLYFSKLGHKLSFKEPKSYPKTEEGVDELLREIEVELKSRGGIEGAANIYMGACALAENLTTQYDFGIRLHQPFSFSATVAKSRDKWEDIVTEFSIANAEWFLVSPLWRLLGFTMQMAAAVDANNKAQLTAPVSADLKEKTEDL